MGLMITEENRSKEIDVGKVNGVATKPPNWWVLGCIYIFLGCDSFCTYKWVERQVWWDSLVFFFLWWFFLLISACCFLMFFDDFDVRGSGITHFFNGKITIWNKRKKLMVWKCSELRTWRMVPFPHWNHVTHVTGQFLQVPLRKAKSFRS